MGAQRSSKSVKIEEMECRVKKDGINDGHDFSRWSGTFRATLYLNSRCQDNDPGLID